MNSAHCQIRKADSADVAAIRTCVDRAYEKYIGRIGKPPGPMLDDYTRAVIEKEVYVAIIETRVAGLLVLCIDSVSIWKNLFCRFLPNKKHNLRRSMKSGLVCSKTLYSLNFTQTTF